MAVCIQDDRFAVRRIPERRQFLKNISWPGDIMAVCTSIENGCEMLNRSLEQICFWLALGVDL